MPVGIHRLPALRGRLSVALAGSITAAALLPSPGAVAAASAPTTDPTTRPSTSTGHEVVVEWNRTLLSLVQATGLQPATVQSTRDFAVMSAAVYDAVEAIDRHHPQYLLRLRAPRGASRGAAAAQAAHDVVAAMFPSDAGALDQQLADDLAVVPRGRARTAGRRVGARAARGLLLARKDDGSDATPPPYRTTGAPGDFRPAPPEFAPPVFTHWAAVKPFALRSGDQFRPPPPAPLRSRAYAAALNRVERLGEDTSSARTDEQTTVAGFWAAPISNYWNAIAEDVSLRHHDDVEHSARTFALLDVGLADAMIALYDAKYAYRLWRPVTALRGAAADGNPSTTAAPTWTPLAATPADPSYPGAHSTVSAAAATILGSLYGRHTALTVTSPTLPGVTRSFRSFGAVADEAGLSRIYAGVHTSLDDHAGRKLGGRVGRFTLRHALAGRPRPAA
jgi:membrane-associated phospholipid phosphatase